MVIRPTHSVLHIFRQMSPYIYTVVLSVFFISQLSFIDRALSQEAVVSVHHPDKPLDVEDAKQLIRTEMDKVYTLTKPINKDIAALYDARHDIIVADIFDKKAYLDISEQLNALHDRKHVLRNTAIIKLARQLHTPSLRTLLATYLDRKRGRRK